MGILDILDISITTWLMVALSAILLRLCIRRPDGLPPGPWIIFPLLGHLPLLKQDTRAALLEMGKKYGEIFHLYFGNCLVIVLNGSDVMRDALLNKGDAFSDRPKITAYDFFGENEGIAFASGTGWKEQRTFTLAALKQLGLGKNILQEKILEEAAAYLKAIEETHGQAFDISIMTQVAMSNIISNMALSKRYEYHDPIINRCAEDINVFGRKVATTGVMNFFPGLKYLPGDFFGLKAIKESREIIENLLLKPIISQHKERLDSDILEDVTYLYLKEMRRLEVEGTLTTMSEKQLLRVMFDLLIAGTETTTTTIRWAVIYLLNYPDVKKNMYDEIQNVIGHRPPRMEDKPKLPYCEAFVLEVQRHADVLPLGVSHATSREIVYKGYRIPKGTLIIPFVHSSMRDPNVWQNPYRFNPDRFLNNGKVMNADKVLPFSVGRRICPGEALAKMELFLILVSMVQRFELLSADTTPPSETDFIVGAVYAPKSFRLKAILRR